MFPVLIAQPRRLSLSCRVDSPLSSVFLIFPAFLKYSIQSSVDFSVFGSICAFVVIGAVKNILMKIIPRIILEYFFFMGFDLWQIYLRKPFFLVFFNWLY